MRRPGEVLLRTIAFMNQKGGVGKTTCAVNLGAALAALRKRVLLVDMDAQANLSLHLGMDVHLLERSSYTVLAGRCTISEAVIRDLRPGLSVLPANIDLAGAEVELVNAVGRETVLRAALARYLAEEPYDFVLLDCPPSLGLLSLNALTAAREVLIPVQTEFFALQGMSRLLDVIELIRVRLGHPVEIAGIVPTLHDTRTNLGREVIAEVQRHFGPLVFRSVIRKSVKLAECPSHGQTILEYAPSSRGAEDFRRFAREVLRREALRGEVLRNDGPAVPAERSRQEESQPGEGIRQASEPTPLH
ncbi:MAG TPA: ParA family protein [Planctomycetota bacterium]|nr:ParA family protein [Planctomycetota bacterium]